MVAKRAAHGPPLHAMFGILVVIAGTARAGDPKPPTIDDAVSRLGSSVMAEATKVDAIWVLSGAQSDADRAKAFTALAAAIDNPLSRIRWESASALARLADPRGAAVIGKQLAIEGDEAALSMEIGALGRLRVRSAVPTVLPFADHANVFVRSAAADALGHLGGDVARQRLLALLAKPGADERWTVRTSVLWSLAKCGRPEDAGVILVAYRDEGGAAWWFARAALASAVAALDPNPVPILDGLMADDDPRVSSTAGTALIRSGRPEEVVKRLSDPRDGVRASAVAAVADGELRLQIPRLKEIAIGDKVRAVRFTAVLALSRLDDPLADSLLVEALDSDDAAVWTAALAECRRKLGHEGGRDPEAWRVMFAARRARLAR